MRLLYWYTRFLDRNGNIRQHHGLNDFELNLSTDAKYHFDVNRYEFLQEPYSTPFPEKFWGDKPLYNINAIVGQNGDGKTTIVHTIMDTLQELYNRELNSPNETVFLAELNGEKTIFHLNASVSNHKEINYLFKPIRFTMGIITSHEDYLRFIDCMKLIYITNTLSKTDDNRYLSGKQKHACSEFIYDCSLSSTIRHDASDLLYRDPQLENQTKNNINMEQDLLRAYFINEHYKQFKYACNCAQREHLLCLRERKLPVPVPEKLFIRIIEFAYPCKYTSYFSNIIKNQSEISDKIAYRICTTCFYSFVYYVSNILKNGLDFYNFFKVEVPKLATSEGFNEIFELIVSRARQNHLSKQEINWINEGKNHYVDFIKFICNQESKKFFDSFEYSQINIEEIEDCLDVTLSVPVREDNIAWLVNFMINYRFSFSYEYQFLDFDWGLSSGENNLLSLFSSFFFAFDDNKSYLHNNSKTKCDSVIIFMDEADLTYHPEWQRQLIQILAAFLPLEFGSCGIDDLQLILTTHSPLLLGDFPSNNVTYLGESNKKEKNTDRLNTFGQNIHTILKDSFFLENGTIGAFAADKINKTAEKLRDKDNLTPEDLKECKAIIDLVAPGILKSKLIELYEETEAGGKESMKQRMKKYAKKLQPDELETFIKVLEEEKRTKNDKN